MTQPNPEIDWSEVPQTIAEYAEITGAPMHRTMPDDHPARPSYHGQGFSFPLLPELSRPEKRIFRHITPKANEKDLRIYTQQIEQKYGQIILHEIISATYDDNLTPEDAFGYDVPKVWPKDPHSALARKELANQPDPSVYEGRAAWWRNRSFLTVAGAFSAVGLAGVMMLPIYAEQPPANSATKQEPPCDPDPSNGIGC